VVFYRGLAGAIVIVLAALARRHAAHARAGHALLAQRQRRGRAMCLWFHALGGLPLATAMTLNYMSSVWMALFLIGGAVLFGARRVEGGWWPAVLPASPAWRWCCGRRIEGQLWPRPGRAAVGRAGAMAYLQVTALGRQGEPDYRIVFYFSAGGMAVGGA
jgi:hypothetical protein